MGGDVKSMLKYFCLLFVIYAYMFLLFNLEYIMCPTDKGMHHKEGRYASHCHISAVAGNIHQVQSKSYKKMAFKGGRGHKNN